MSPPAAHGLARTAFTPALVAVILLVGILLVDWAVDRHLGPREDERIAALEERVESDARVEPVLSVERDWQTTRSLDRKHRIRLVSALLILASAVFLTSAKSLSPGMALAFPPLDDLVARRFPTPEPASPGSPRKKRAPEPDLSAVDEIVKRIGKGADGAIAILQEIQEVFGYLPDAAMERVAETTDVTPSQLAGTSSFYSRFRRTPRGDHLVRVCHGTACHVAGAQHIEEELRRHLEIPDGADTDRERRFTLAPVACLGCCSLAPVIMVDERTAGRLNPGTASAALRQAEAEEC